MNDQASGWSPDSEDDPDDDRLRSTVERRLMERARLAAARDREKGPRRPLQHAIALAAALALVVAIMLGFDAFLTSMQKVMQMLDQEEARQKQEQAERKLKEPMPAYVVPGDEPPPATEAPPPAGTPPASER